MDFPAVVWVRRAARSGQARALREAAGIRQHELAGGIGVSRSALCHWEAGRRCPSVQHAERWAELLRSLT